MVRSPGRRVRRRAINHPDGVDLDTVAESATYVGSAEHKTYRSSAGAPRPRADATKCDPELHGEFSTLNAWLQEAIRAGRVGGVWEGRYPRYAWIEKDGRYYEARLVNADQGQYKGYEISRDEFP
jgi:hypothetical protein